MSLKCEGLETRTCLSAIALIVHEVGVGESYGTQFVADLDSDGDLDILSEAWDGDGSAAFRWHENLDGAGGFGSGQPIGLSADQIAAVADIDGDDVVDILTDNIDSVRWHRNSDGMGGFETHGQTIGSAGRVFPFDVDGDGDTDVVTSGAQWFENLDGQGTFENRPHVIDANEWIYISNVGDVDGDGDMDLLSGGYRSPLTWYENLNGQGTFEQPEALCGWFGGPLGVADINGDGQNDIITQDTNDTDSTWTNWCEYSEGGQGQSHHIASAAPLGDDYSGVLAYLDLDGDGDLDFLGHRYSRGPDRGGLIWLENTNGQGEFVEHNATRGFHSSGLGWGPNPVGDLDLDGDLDFVLKNETGLAWYEARLVGDSSDDGVFDSSDLVTAFTAGKYEDGIPDNATFDEGDWNQDGDFDSSDLVLAFQSGRYTTAARPLTAEIAAATDWLFARDDDAKKARELVA